MRHAPGGRCIVQNNCRFTAVDLVIHDAAVSYGSIVKDAVAAAVQVDVVDFVVYDRDGTGAGGGVTAYAIIRLVEDLVIGNCQVGRGCAVYATPSAGYGVVAHNRSSVYDADTPSH